MKAMTTEEAIGWCSQPLLGLKVTSDGMLRYKGNKTRKFFIAAPEEHRRIVFLARQLLCFRGEANFSGGLLWLRRWNIGSPQLVWPGWLILETFRRADGEQRSLEAAPAQYFRDDELVKAHAFLIQSIAFGWVTDFVPACGGYMFRFKDNRQICCMAESTAALNELRGYLREWNPTDEDPMVRKLASMENARRRA